MAAAGPIASSAPTAADCAARDAAFTDFDELRAAFAAGEPGTVYLDANSIGPMPADAPARLARLLDDGWRVQRRRGWNDPDWLDGPRRLGAALAPLIGAGDRDVLICDTTSVNQYKLLRHALAVAAPRRVIVAEADVFPTNRYVATGIAHAGAAELRLLPAPRAEGGAPSRSAALAASLEQALAAGDVAVVALSHVDYRSSERLDLAALTALCHAHGATVLWDLSHSAGAFAIDLAGADADYAVASGYKYLCGGPGAPALLYVHPRWQEQAWPAICGWMGHADTFAFDGEYQPAPGVERQLAGTPLGVANTVFGAAAEIWCRVDPARLDARHRSLGDTLIALLET
ncbi:MAG: aminotransferase class V-fold PLP-dependent enzyme, partial [Lautropia sp.]